MVLPVGLPWAKAQPQTIHRPTDVLAAIRIIHPMSRQQLIPRRHTASRGLMVAGDCRMVIRNAVCLWFCRGVTQT